MSGLRAFAAFWYDFVIGDDWRVAVGVVLGLTVTSVIAHVGHHDVWWLMPLVVLLGLSLSVLGVARRELKRPD